MVEALKTRVVARTDKRQEGHEEVLVIIRYMDREEQMVKPDYYLSNADGATPLAELARVAKAEHRIEECLQRARVKRVWVTTKCATGKAGNTIRRCR